MERHYADLECEARDDEHEAQRERKPLLGNRRPIRIPRAQLAERLRYLRDVQRARDAVDHRHAIQQQARRERPEHEVLHSRFGRHCRIPVERNHGIQAQRHQLEAQIQREEVIARDHHHHAEHREERQREVFAAIHAAIIQIGSRVDEAHGHRDIRHELQDRRHRVGDEHAVEGKLRCAASRLERHDRHQRTAEQRELRQDIGDRSGAIGDDEINEQHDRSCREQPDLSRSGQQIRHRR